MTKPDFRRTLILTALLWLFSLVQSAWAQDTGTDSAAGKALESTDSNPQVELTTNVGSMVLELYPDVAPETVKNFLQYVEDGFYSGTIFHRIIPDFMMQGGGYDESFEKKETRPAIQNEADNQLKNDRFTIAMARTPAPHSATAQFFINTANNDFLNHKAKTQAGWGYTVFGKIVEGQKIAEWIGKVPTGSSGPFPTDVPATPIIIEEVTIKTDQ